MAASVFQTHCLIIAQTYQRDDVCERDKQRDHFRNCYILVARRAGCHASHVALGVVHGRRGDVFSGEGARVIIALSPGDL